MAIQPANLGPHSTTARWADGRKGGESPGAVSGEIKPPTGPQGQAWLLIAAPNPEQVNRWTPCRNPFRGPLLGRGQAPSWFTQSGRTLRVQRSPHHMWLLATLYVAWLARGLKTKPQGPGRLQVWRGLPESLHCRPLRCWLRPRLPPTAGSALLPPGDLPTGAARPPAARTAHSCGLPAAALTGSFSLKACSGKTRRGPSPC